MTHLALLCCIFTFIGQSLPNTALISEQIQAKLNSRNRANKSFLGKRGGFGGGEGVFPLTLTLSVVNSQFLEFLSVLRSNLKRKKKNKTVKLSASPICCERELAHIQKVLHATLFLCNFGLWYLYYALSHTASFSKLIGFYIPLEGGRFKIPVFSLHSATRAFWVIFHGQQYLPFLEDLARQGI